MDLMGLKSKILDEILEDLEDHQGSSLKPKAAISVTAVKPEVGMAVGHEEPDGDELGSLGSSPSGELGGSGDDGDDDVLRRLLEEYASSK